MSPDSVPCGSVRPAAEVNEQIRALWLRASGSLSAQEREEYELLVVEWAKAMRTTITKAA